MSLGGLSAAPLAEPQGERANAAPASCPYHFGSDMPAATFCVYQGVALGGNGQICATDVVVIWNSPASEALAAERPTEEPSDSEREVYLAFVADPEPVVRAIADSRQGDRAEVADYTAATHEAPQPMAGRITRRATRQGLADILTIDLRGTQRLQLGDCAFASYSGTFLGLMQPPSETTSSDSLTLPRP